MLFAVPIFSEGFGKTFNNFKLARWEILQTIVSHFNHFMIPCGITSCAELHILSNCSHNKLNLVIWLFRHGNSINFDSFISFNAQWSKIENSIWILLGKLMISVTSICPTADWLEFLLQNTTKLLSAEVMKNSRVIMRIVLLLLAKALHKFGFFEGIL